MKILVVCAVATLACLILLIICLRDSESVKSVFHHGQECDPNEIPCPPIRPNNYNVEKGIVFASNIVQTENKFEMWTNVSIWMESSARYCNHLTYVQSGFMKDAQDYLALFNNSTSYYFATTLQVPWTMPAIQIMCLIVPIEFLLVFGLRCVFVGGQ